MHKICVVTGNRAEYWLLRPLMRLLNDSEALKLILIATGDHLKGDGIQKICQDGFTINAEVKCCSDDDTYLSMTTAIGKGIQNFAQAYALLKPDIVILLGDRFEILAAAVAAYGQKIPIAHIHGGELTFGALDEGFRHTISKLSHLHFVSHLTYKKRLIRMGETPQTVFVVGAIGLDNLAQFQAKPRRELFRELALNEGKYFLFTLHSSTLDNTSMDKAAKEVMKALEEFQDYKIVITQSNMDPGGQFLNSLWKKWQTEQPHRIHFIPTLGDNYLHMVFHSELVIGNSSSGILEVPYLNKLVINIGQRQKGRIFPQGVFQAGYNINEIKEQISFALSNPSFETSKIYGIPGNIAFSIYEILKNHDLQSLTYKVFYDEE
jgi:UDP-hydrolysing UDP-N-acetyl-D-glucosamine 2-epimerase